MSSLGILALLAAASLILGVAGCSPHLYGPGHYGHGSAQRHVHGGSEIGVSTQTHTHTDTVRTSLGPGMGIGHGPMGHMGHRPGFRHEPHMMNHGTGYRERSMLGHGHSHGQGHGHRHVHGHHHHHINSSTSRQGRKRHGHKHVHKSSSSSHRHSSHAGGHGHGHVVHKHHHHRHRPHIIASSPIITPPIVTSGHVGYVDDVPIWFPFALIFIIMFYMSFIIYLNGDEFYDEYDYYYDEYYRKGGKEL